MFSAHFVVYRFYDVDRNLLYVGCTGDFGNRLAQHSRDKPWWRYVATVTLEHFDDEVAAFAAEAAAIGAESPIWNNEQSIIEFGAATDLVEAAPGQPAPPVMLKIGEVAAVLGVCVATARNYAKDDLLEFRVSAGGHRRVDASSAEHLATVLKIRDARARKDALNGIRLRVRALASARGGLNDG